MTVDLKALANTVARHPRIEELKELPILYVFERAGIAYEEKADGVYVAASPFRDDNNPSFDVFGEDLERWGDFAEGTGGDVLDLIARLIEQYTGAAPQIQVVKDEAARLLGEYKLSGWTGPTSGAKRKSFDLVAARAYVASIQDRPAYGLVGEWQLGRKDFLASIPTAWLVDTFRLADDGGQFLIPYFDRAGSLEAYKTRTVTGPVIAAEGSAYGDLLYGLWLDDGESTVVLCEGESDVWSGTHAAQQGYVFLGLPTGAGSRPRQAHLLRDRRVILAFDGDTAGRSATLKWADALREVNAEVLIAYVPDDFDLSKMSPDDRRLTIESALPSRPLPQDAPVEMPGSVGYERIGQKQSTQISDWTFTPQQVLIGEEGVTWDGVVAPMGRRAQLRSQDLSSKPNVIRWSQQQGASWLGSDRDAQLLASTFHAQSTFLPRGRAVSYTGLHDGIIVYPGGRLGHSNYVYVPGKIDVPLANMVHIADSLEQPPVPVGQFVASLRELHHHSVTDPILAWLALAPLRSKLGQFPILAVTGGSGTGKTTLVREMLRHFTATTINTNLTGTTKFAMLGYMGSTNAFPVWFDEYRPGARRETLAEFNQLLRDAYTGQSSIKGGMGDSWASVREVPVRAPIVVSGEDSFSETSHTERMVLVHLPKEGKNPELMARVIAAPTTGFAGAYYEWVREAAVPALAPEGPVFLPDRQRHNLGVLRAGWKLLQAFIDEEGNGEDLGEPDWSLIITEGAEAAESNPILDSVRWALEEPRLQEQRCVFVQGDHVHIRVDTLVAEVNRSGTFALPGGAKAVAKYLRTHLQGDDARPRINRLGSEVRIRTIAIPVDLVVSEE